MDFSESRQLQTLAFPLWRSRGGVSEALLLLLLLKRQYQACLNILVIGFQVHHNPYFASDRSYGRRQPASKQPHQHTVTKTCDRQDKRSPMSCHRMIATNYRVFSSAQGAVLWLREPNEYVYELSTGMAGSRSGCWWMMSCLWSEARRHAATPRYSEKPSRGTQMRGTLTFPDYVSNKFMHSWHSEGGGSSSRRALNDFSRDRFCLLQLGI